MGALHLIPDPLHLRDSLALAEEYGACLEYNDFFAPALLDDAESCERRVALYLAQPRDRSRDTLHGAFYDVTVHSDDPQIRRVSEARVMQSLSIARTLGVRGAVFHTGTIPNFLSAPYEQNWLRRNAAFWRKTAEAYPELEILMENMFDMRSDLLLALADELADLPRFGVCLDWAHASVFGETEPAERWCERLAPHIRHLHVNDHDGRSDLHEAVGRGACDWTIYDRAARALPCRPSVLIEVGPLEKQRASLAYMKENRLYPFD
ncbi:MAG: sugar phosphate isomerase/epimerase [Oscillospiraceae bacterium]|nr:sugar phosphate isomerase/epimerase [Oscillospiraceae bacterium]